MKKIDFSSVKNMNWFAFFRKNKYTIVSLFVSVFYFYATFFAVSFVVKDIRDAFSVNDGSAKNQVVGFDLDTYQKIAPRFSGDGK